MVERKGGKERLVLGPNPPTGHEEHQQVHDLVYKEKGKAEEAEAAKAVVVVVHRDFSEFAIEVGSVLMGVGGWKGPRSTAFKNLL